MIIHQTEIDCRDTGAVVLVNEILPIPGTQAELMAGVQKHLWQADEVKMRIGRVTNEICRWQVKYSQITKPDGLGGE